jgi:hypothetical protein
MSHVDGVDDGVGYGVFGKTTINVGVDGESDSGYGVYGLSNTREGVVGFGPHGSGVHGQSNDGQGVVGTSSSGFGVYGVSIENTGVVGESFDNVGSGVVGISHGDLGAGVVGIDNDGGTGVVAVSRGKVRGNGGTGVVAVSREKGGVGVVAVGTPDGIGLIAVSRNDHGLLARSTDGDGVSARSTSGNGVHGVSDNGTGVRGESINGGAAVAGQSINGYGVYASSGNSYAAYLDGKVYIRGPLQKPGGSFKIDHPLDPANKYLCHSFVESPDMKNIYDGVVALNKRGEAEIDLPDWFTALNMDYRYQLTAIGAPGPNLYIAKEISESGTYDIDTAGNTKNNYNHNRSSFKIAGGTSDMKVSWQVTGIRKDPWANAHRVQVEEDKPDKERGHYIYPELYNQPADKGIGRLLIPQEMKVPLVTKNR